MRSPASAWPSPRKWVTPELAVCLVGTKINLPSLSSPPLASVPSVLALISSPGDESFGSWGGRLHRAQPSLASCPEPRGPCHRVHACRRAPVCHPVPCPCGCGEHRGAGMWPCASGCLHPGISSHRCLCFRAPLNVSVCECVAVACVWGSKCQEMREQ